MRWRPGFTGPIQEPAEKGGRWRAPKLSVLALLMTLTIPTRTATFTPTPTSTGTSTPTPTATPATPAPTATFGGGPAPPATYYGPVLAGAGFTPRPGMPVTAWIDGNLCGQGRTLDVNGQVMYIIKILSAGPGNVAGCGAPGRTVTFQIGPRVMVPTAVWNNTRVWELPASAAPLRHSYLPLIVKEP